MLLFVVSGLLFINFAIGFKILATNSILFMIFFDGFACYSNNVRFYYLIQILFKCLFSISLMLYFVISIDYFFVFINFLKGQKVYNRPDAAASFFCFFFQKPKKDIACSRTGGV